MKSAYELAMERLEREDPAGTTPPLSEAQKTDLAAIEEKYRARIAEREIFLGKKREEARRSRDREALSQIDTQLRNERERLREACEQEKEKVRQDGRGG